MKAQPLRLLVQGYGLALAAAVAVQVAGGGAMAAALMLWLGGAAAVLGLGALLPAEAAAGAPPVQAPLPRGDTPDWLQRERELIAWDRDLAEDQAAARRAAAPPGQTAAGRSHGAGDRG